MSPSNSNAKTPGWAPPAALTAAWLVGGVFVLSSITKILAPKVFVATLAGYGLLPSGWSLAAATGVAGLELALGVLLVLGFHRRAAAWIALPLVLLFIGLVLHALRLGLSSCGCFGEVLELPPQVEIGVDLVLLGLLGLVLWRGENVQLESAAFTDRLGWVLMLTGSALFLLGGPTGAGEDPTMDVSFEQLEALRSAQPPLDPQKVPDAFYFLFSADCDHCWAFAGGVEMTAQRLAGIEVHGVTASDPQAMEGFRAAFVPSYPIHVLGESAFDGLTDEYPAAIWVQGGKVARAWSGFVPSLRSLAELGGYEIRPGSSISDPRPTVPESTGSAGDGSSRFGGPLRAQRH